MWRLGGCHLHRSVLATAPNTAPSTAADIEPKVGSVVTNMEVVRGAESSGLNSTEEYIQPEKNAQVDVANLGSSQPMGTELLSQAKEEASSKSSAALQNGLTGEG